MASPQEIKVKGKAARIRGATWTHDQVKKLFDVWTQPDIYHGLLNEKKKQDIFKNMASILTSLGVHRTWSECRAKIKNLKADFRKAMEKKTPFRYYEQMKKIMNLDGSATATTLAPSTSQPFHEEQWDVNQEKVPATSPAAVSDSAASKETQSPFSDRYPPSHEDDDRASSDSGEMPTTSQRLREEMHTFYQSRDQTRSFQEYEYQATRSTTPTYPPKSEPITPPASSIDAQLQESSPEQIQDRMPHPHDWSRAETEARQSPDYRRHHSFPHPHDEIERPDPTFSRTPVITHVVSNVIEPVTTVVVPSSSHVSESHRSLAEVSDPSSFQSVVEQAPLRLEFVVDDGNVVLHQPSPPPEETGKVGSSLDETLVLLPEDSDTSPFPTITDRASIQPSPSFLLPEVPTVHPENIQHRAAPKRSEILRHRLGHKRPIPMPPARSQLGSDKHTRPQPLPDQGRKRKLLDILNKKTVETISSLLTETSQSLVREMQEAEQRFLSWEEEKRQEERKREEVMFTKLITAMKTTVPSSSRPSSPASNKNADTEGSISFASTYSSMSKRLNDMVCDEVKTTEETLRQWEMKMHRQESRHTEKLFAMIINAIKTPTTIHPCDDDD